MGSFIRFLLFLASRLRNAGAPNLSFNHFLKIFHQSNRNLNHRHQCFPAKNVCLIPIEPYVVCILISKIQACHPLVQPPLCLAVPYPFVKCFLCHSLTGFLVQPASFLQTFCGMSGYIHKITRFPFLLSMFISSKIHSRQSGLQFSFIFLTRLPPIGSLFPLPVHTLLHQCSLYFFCKTFYLEL